MAPAGALPSGTQAGRRTAGARDPLPRRHVRLSRRRRRCSIASISRFPPARRSPSSARTAPARRRSPSCCAGFYDPQSRRDRDRRRRSARSRSRRRGARASPRSSRTSSASSCRCATTWRRPARPTTSIRAALDRGRRRRPGGARHGAGARLRRRHRSVRRPVAAGRAGAGACARCSSAPASCCSTSRPRSSTSAAKPRSSSASSRRRGTARRSSSRIASRRCARPIASACSSTAASSSSARTTS